MHCSRGSGSQEAWHGATHTHTGTDRHTHTHTHTSADTVTIAHANSDNLYPVANIIEK